jgi:hypothetical protein
MRVAPDDPEKPIGFESQFFYQVVRQAGVPFTSSNFSDRKTRWVDFGKVRKQKAGSAAQAAFAAIPSSA